MLENLKDTGVVVYSMPNIEFNVARFLEQQVEFIDTSKPLRISARGLLGNPSSQHCPEIRRVRQQIYDHLRPELQKVFPGKYVQFLVDRVSVRYRDTRITGDDWHRDVSGEPEEGTRIFGGWFNLNSPHSTAKDILHHKQYFSHVPCSWADVLPSGHNGYDRLSVEDVARYKTMSRVATIMPGEGIIFDENTVHEVKHERRPKDSKPSWRLYIKVKISSNANVTFGENVILTRLENQAMMPLNLTDECPMYDSRHLVYWSSKVEEFSKNMKPVFVVVNKTKQMVRRFLQSLKEAKEEDPTIQLHPEYTEREKAHLLPTLLQEVEKEESEEEEEEYCVKEVEAILLEELYYSKEAEMRLLQKEEDEGPYKRAKTCQACIDRLPNQMAHMEPGGCLEVDLDTLDF